MSKLRCRLMLLAVMLLAASGAAFENVAIDATNFPDANFRSYVSSNFDTDGNGILNDSEIGNVTEIDVSNKSISSLKGVENFTALTYLDCRSNQLTALDVSNNTALTMLACGWNKLTTLDVSKNTALTELQCGYNQLTALDVSKNTALMILDCSHNQLTALDLSKNTALTILDCDFTIDSADNRFSFNIVDFMKAYKPLGEGLLYVDFRYHYGDSGNDFGML